MKIFVNEGETVESFLTDVIGIPKQNLEYVATKLRYLMAKEFAKEIENWMIYGIPSQRKENGENGLQHEIR